MLSECEEHGYFRGETCPKCDKKFESEKMVGNSGKTYAVCNHCGNKLVQKAE